MYILVWISGSCCFCHFLHCMIVFLFHLYSGFTIGCKHARSRFAVSYKSSEIRTPSTKTWQWERRHSKHSRTSNGKSPKTQSRYAINETPPSGRAALGRCQVEWSHPARLTLWIHPFLKNCNHGELRSGLSLKKKSLWFFGGEVNL